MPKRRRVPRMPQRPQRPWHQTMSARMAWRAGRTKMPKVTSVAVWSRVLTGLALLTVIVRLANVTTVVCGGHAARKCPCERPLHWERTLRVGMVGRQRGNPI